MAAKPRGGSRTTKKTTRKSTARKVKKETVPSTEFSLYAPDAKAVYLAGDFNGWQPDDKAFRLRKYKGDVWKKKVNLKAGRYEYLFVVDDEWWCDPANDNRVTNPYCTQNSVVEVG